MNIISLLLILAIASGQLVKFPASVHGGVTLLDLVVGGLCLLGLIRLNFKLKRPPQYILAAGLFILVATLSLLLSPLRLSFFEYLTSFYYTLRFLLYMLLSWIVYSKAFPSFSKRISKVLILAGFALSILGVLQLIFYPDLLFLSTDGWDPHYFRNVSTFLDPNFTGAFYALTLLLVTKMPKSYLSKLLFSLIFFSLLTTFSRSAYLLFSISFLALSYFIKSIKLAAATLVLSMILWIGFYSYINLISQPRNIDRTQSAQFRVNTWQQGGVLLQNYPILGVGFNTYKYALKQLSLAPKAQLASRGATSNDSSLLFVAATTGLVGLTAYIFFLGSLIFSVFKENKILVAALVGLLVHSLFANSLFYPFILIWILLYINNPSD